MSKLSEFHEAYLLQKGIDIMSFAVEYLQPSRVLELGTGDGVAACAMMEVLPEPSKLVTIGWPHKSSKKGYPDVGDNPMKYLEPWKDDSRLKIISCDILDPEAREQAGEDFDLVWVDSTHTYSHAVVEWSIYESSFANNAIILMDDLNMYDLVKYWDELPYEKLLLGKAGDQGMFQYTR